MVGTQKTVKLMSQARAKVSGAAFSGDLFGECHSFEFDNKKVRVRLPKVKFVKGTIQPEGEIARYIKAAQYNTKRPTRKGSFFYVDLMIVEADIPERLTIPSALLVDQAVTNMECASRKETKKLNEIASEFRGLMVGVWKHWQQVASWATGNRGFNLSGIHVPENEGGLRLHSLVHKGSKHDVWALPTEITARLGVRVNREIWDHIGTALETGRSAPVWMQYLDEASQRIDDFDYSGSVLSCAIACETVARASFDHVNGRPSNQAAADLIDRIAAQGIIGKWKDLTGIAKSGAVHQIFDLRNALVHSGSAGNVTRKQADDSLSAAKKFVEDADEWLFQQRGEPNPRLSCPVIES